MSIQVLFDLILEEYALVRHQAFTGNSIANIFRDDLPKEIAQLTGNSARYKVEGSPGKGKWAAVPWVAIFDRLVTETAQSGYYLVYLVKADCSGIYLSLNQGVMTVREQYGSKAKEALGTRSRDFLARLGHRADGLDHGDIDLVVREGLGTDYQKGSVCSVFYAQHKIPSDDSLQSDLHHFLSLYRHLVNNDTSLYTRADMEEDEVNCEMENLKRLREHKRIERNRKLAAKAKRFHGYTCKACGFNFEKAYGPLGREFIEAHHLVPLSDLVGDIVMLDPKTDFSVLCSNCHRMIHRSEFISQIDQFRAKYIAR